jgi:ATP-dependent Clp protease ATP-binding subunit ClpA
MLNRELEMTLQQVLMEAKSKSYELVTVEQVLLALIDNPSAGVVLRSVCKNVTELKTELMQHISEETPKLGIGQIEPIPTHGFQNILQRAVFQVQSSGGQEVSGTSLLVSIFAEEDEDSHAVYLLKRQGVTRYKLIDYISHGSSEKSSTQSPNENGTGEEETSLSKFTTNLNEKAANGDIDPIIGRDSELERVQQILGRRRKNNPILVGEAGVGKTAIAEGLALNIVNGNVSKELINSVVYSVDIGDLVAGTKYRGDFEKRFKALLKELSSQENAIMFIDEIHTIIGAGAASGGVMDASNLLKPK